MLNALINAAVVVYCSLASLKAFEILVDMAGTIRRGRQLAVSIQVEANTYGEVEIAQLEKDAGRRQPVYSALLRLRASHPKIARTLRLLYWAPSLAAIGFIVSSFGNVVAPLRVTLAISITSFVMLILVNAPLRRLILGQSDRFNRDLIATGGHGLADAVLRSDRAATALASYFLWLIFVSVVGFAATYQCLWKLSDATFHVMSASPLKALYFSVVTVSTIGYGDVYPTKPIGMLAVLAQVTTGPLILAWLVSAFFSSATTSGPTIVNSTYGRPEEVQNSATRLAAAIFCRDREVLLALRAEDADFRPGVWDLIGGHVEARESPREAVVREAYEEVGVRLTELSADPVARWVEDAIDLSIWAVFEWEGKIVNSVPGQHQEIRWISLADLDSISLGDDRYRRLFGRVVSSSFVETREP